MSGAVPVWGSAGSVGRVVGGKEIEAIAPGVNGDRCGGEREQSSEGDDVGRFGGER